MDEDVLTYLRKKKKKDYKFSIAAWLRDAARKKMEQEITSQ